MPTNSQLAQDVRTGLFYVLGLGFSGTRSEATPLPPVRARQLVSVGTGYTEAQAVRLIPVAELEELVACPVS